MMDADITYDDCEGLADYLAGRQPFILDEPDEPDFYKRWLLGIVTNPITGWSQDSNEHQEAM